MVIRCRNCGDHLDVGSFWQAARCPSCGHTHVRLDEFPSWSLIKFDPMSVTWQCWACDGQFEVWRMEDRAHCPHCGVRNTQISLVIPVTAPS
jgi:Zn finger protein HypA/HybF involved in hydrogenase expression